jgi:hypothetical protein
VRLAQPLLVEPVRLREHLLRRRLRDVALLVDELVLQVGHLRGEAPARVALGVEVQVAGDHRHQPDRVTLVVDRERRLQAELGRLGAQDAHAHRVERRDPHRAGARPDEVSDPLLHLARGLVGERDREDLAGLGVPGAQQVGDPVREHPRLARTGARDDEQRTALVDDGLALRAVETGEHPLELAPDGSLGGALEGGCTRQGFLDAAHDHITVSRTGDGPRRQQPPPHPPHHVGPQPHRDPSTARLRGRGHRPVTDLGGPGPRTGSWRSPAGCGRLRAVLATVSFYYGHRDPVSVTAG